MTYSASPDTSKPFAGGNGYAFSAADICNSGQYAQRIAVNSRSRKEKTLATLFPNRRHRRYASQNGTENDAAMRGGMICGSVVAVNQKFQSGRARRVRLAKGRLEQELFAVMIFPTINML